MSRFLAQFLAGSAVAGSLSYFFHSTIQSRTQTLYDDLASLSTRLTQLTPTTATSGYAVAEVGSIPERIPLTEHVKSRWNEQLGSAVLSLQTVELEQVLKGSWSKVQEGIAFVKTKLDS